MVSRRNKNIQSRKLRRFLQENKLGSKLYKVSVKQHKRLFEIDNQELHQKSSSFGCDQELQKFGTNQGTLY